MNKLEEMRTRLGVTQENMADIMSVYMAAAIAGGEDAADTIPALLNKYEEEILRQQDVIARLQQKNRNYRTGIKALQRAHEASLHRENAESETINQLREFLDRGNVCGVVEYDGQLIVAGPYSLVNFKVNVQAAVNTQFVS